MPQPKPTPDSDYATKRETRRLSPVTEISTGGLGGTIDPAQEVGNLIAQLQASAREAQERAVQMERERDEFHAKLEAVSVKFHEISTREKEGKARFVEVTSVIRERDELLETVEFHQKSIAELQRRIDAMQRQEVDLQRQRGALLLDRDRAAQERDSVKQQRDDTYRECEDFRTKFAEAQKQVLSIRQARDAAQAQCRDLSGKVQHLGDQLHELTHERDQARSEAKEATELRRLRDEAIAERDQLAEQQSKAGQLGSEHAASLAQAREEVLKLTQERDAARSRAQETERELGELRTALDRARLEAGPGGLSLSERESLDERIKAITGERDRLRGQILDFEQWDEELTRQTTAAQQSRDEVFASLSAAQKQIEHIMRDRDQVRQQGIDRVLAIESELKSATGKLAELEKKIADTRRERDQALEKADHFDQQRLAALDTAAELDAAKRELKKLTAALAEARLEAKANLSRGSIPRTPPPLLKASVGAPASPGATPVPTTPSAELDDEVLTEKEAKGLLIEIKRCHATFAKAPTDFSLLNELHCQLDHFAERARVSGFLGLHRISHALSQLAQDLYRFPEQVNPSTMRTMSQTIDLIGTLLKQKNYAAIKDPANAHIFAVDDDAENCDTIRLAMENISMRTRTAQEPAVALAEISTGDYDLIFLDVALPHMDGFELCQHIRSLPNHARTPVVFLTGLTTIENRVQSSLSGGNDFIGKPFNLQELCVKAVSLVLKASLHLE